jgi:hypothetical protein
MVEFQLLGRTREGIPELVQCPEVNDFGILSDIKPKIETFTKHVSFLIYCECTTRLDQVSEEEGKKW